MSRRGPIGTDPDYPDSLYGVHGHLRHVAPICAESNRPSTIEAYESHLLAKKLLRAVGAEFESAVRGLLGGLSFSVGFVQSVGPKSFQGVTGPIELVRTVALAECYELQCAGLASKRLGPSLSRNGLGPSSPITTFWRDFELQSRRAYKERNALVESVRSAYGGGAVAYAGLAGTLDDAYAAFAQHSAFNNTLAGNAQAGELFGQMLQTLLTEIALPAGLLQLAAEVGGTSEFLPKIERIALAFRTRATGSPTTGTASGTARQGVAYSLLNIPKTSADAPSPPAESTELSAFAPDHDAAAQAATLIEAAKHGIPFCEICDKHRASSTPEYA